MTLSHNYLNNRNRPAQRRSSSEDNLTLRLLRGANLLRAENRSIWVAGPSREGDPR